MFNRPEGWTSLLINVPSQLASVVHIVPKRKGKRADSPNPRQSIHHVDAARPTKWFLVSRVLDGYWNITYIHRYFSSIFTDLLWLMQSCVWSRLPVVRHKISCIWPGSRQCVLLLLPLKLCFFKKAWKLCDWMRREPKCPGPRRMVPQLPCKRMQMSCLGALVVSDGNLQAGKGYGNGILEVPVAATNPGGFITDPTFLGKPAAWERAWIGHTCR